MTDRSSRDRPLIRPTARVLVVSPADRVLLFRATAVDDDTGKPFWFPPAADSKRTRRTSRRPPVELLEETGLTCAIGACLWLREHTWYWQTRGFWLTSVERYYLVRSQSEEVGVSTWTDYAAPGPRPETRWWSLPEIQASDHTFVPRELARLLPDVLAGRLPAEPLTVI